MANTNDGPETPINPFHSDPGSLRAEMSRPRSDPAHPGDPKHPNAPESVGPAFSGPACTSPASTTKGSSDASDATDRRDRSPNATSVVTSTSQALCSTPPEASLLAEHVCEGR